MHFHLICTQSIPFALFQHIHTTADQESIKVFWAYIHWGILSWTSNIPPTSSAQHAAFKKTTVTLFYHTASQIKKKDWDKRELVARGLDKLSCQRPLNVIHKFTGRLFAVADAASLSRGSYETRVKNDFIVNTASSQLQQSMMKGSVGFMDAPREGRGFPLNDGII